MAYVDFCCLKDRPQLLAPIAVAAYSYMSLVPIIQPPVMKLMTTKTERRIRMEYTPRAVSRRALVLFPILVTLLVGLLVPAAIPLIGALMLGNLITGKHRVDRLSKSAQNELSNIVTLFLGVTIGSNNECEQLLAVGDYSDSAPGFSGVCIGYFCWLALWEISCIYQSRDDQSLIGAAGISAFPMAGRLLPSRPG